MIYLGLMDDANGTQMIFMVFFGLTPLMMQLLNLHVINLCYSKQGKTIPALFHNQMLCPKCQKPMSVLRDLHGNVYYYCHAHYSPWIKEPCTYAHFIPGRWDNELQER